MNIDPSDSLFSNRGGGRVESFRLVTEPPDHHLLHLTGPPGAVAQVMKNDSRYVEISSSVAGAHSLRAEGEPKPSTRKLLELLSSVLTVPAYETDYALALDRYKQPDERADPNTWSNTPLAETVSRGKYLHKHPDHPERRRLGAELADRLSRIVEGHPLLASVDAVIAVPGHDPMVRSFGEQLAAGVAQRRSLPLIRCTKPSSFQTSAKDIDPDERRARMMNLFTCRAPQRVNSALIIDDVYGSGATTGEAARAARAANVSHVAALCVVRTIRLPRK